MKKRLLITLAALISCGVIAIVIAQTQAEMEAMFDWDKGSATDRMVRGELSGQNAFPGATVEDRQKAAEMNVQRWKNEAGGQDSVEWFMQERAAGRLK